MRRQRFFKVSASLLGILLVVGLLGLNSAQAFIAYDTGVQTGNQAWGGSLGMDFDVNTPILISQLGVFDSAGDGIIGTTTTLYAAIFDRTGSNPIVVPTIAFTNGNPGTFNNGSLFKGAGNVLLGAGQYTIVSWGYNGSDPNGNLTAGPLTPSTLDNGGGLISFVVNSPWDNTAGVFPLTPYPSTNVFLAGTFEYNPVPLPPTALLLGSGLLGLGLLRFRKRA